MVPGWVTLANPVALLFPWMTPLPARAVAMELTFDGPVASEIAFANAPNIWPGAVFPVAVAFAVVLEPMPRMMVVASPEPREEFRELLLDTLATGRCRGDREDAGAGPIEIKMGNGPSAECSAVRVLCEGDFPGAGFRTHGVEQGHMPAGAVS